MEKQLNSESSYLINDAIKFVLNVKLNNDPNIIVLPVRAKT